MVMSKCNTNQPTNQPTNMLGHRIVNRHSRSIGLYQHQQVQQQSQHQCQHHHHSQLHLQRVANVNVINQTTTTVTATTKAKAINRIRYYATKRGENKPLTPMKVCMFVLIFNSQLNL